MVFSDDLYSNNPYPELLSAEWAEILADAEANAPELTTQNFAINTRKATWETVPLLTPEDLAHEWAYSHPLWKSLDAMYRSAAIGYSKEIAGREVTRLCDYIVVRARPSGEAAALLTIQATDIFRHSKMNQEGFLSEMNVPYSITLTGQFVDMPDGRWHYVEIGDFARYSNRQIFYKYLNKEYLAHLIDELIAKYEAYGATPSKEEIDSQLSLNSQFYFGFVREDMLGQVKAMDLYYFSQEFADKYEEIFGKEEYYYELHAVSPWWVPKEYQIDATDLEIGKNVPYNVLLYYAKEEIEALNLPRLFAHYPVSSLPSPTYYKPAGKKAWLVLRSDNDPSKSDFANELKYYTAVGAGRYDLISYREPMEGFFSIFEDRTYPGYYKYKYEYIANADAGNSYLYYLLPIRDILHLKSDSAVAYFDNPALARSRVNVFHNRGDTDFSEEIEDTFSDGAPTLRESEEIEQKNLLLTAGVLSLGLAFLRE